jgi:hypothetical protein
MATIALRNSPSWNCHLRLDPQPKRKQLPQQLGKSHAPRERRQRKPARTQRLDARSFFGHPQLSVYTFPPLVLKICRNRFSCHGPSVAEVSPSKLSNFGHSDNVWASKRSEIDEFRVRQMTEPPQFGVNERGCDLLVHIGALILSCCATDKAPYHKQSRVPTLKELEGITAVRGKLSEGGVSS